MIDQDATDRPPADRREYLAAWSATHGGVETSRPGLVRGWLTIVHLLARPLAAVRVPPDVVTVLGALVAAAVVPVAALQGRWALLVAAVVLVAGLLDGVDGAVALLTGRSTRWGGVLDALADRCSDTALVVGLLALGGWDDAAWVRWGAAAAAGLSLLHEYLRARAAQAGLTDVAVVTVAERPTRVVIALMFSLAAGLQPEQASSWGAAGVLAWCATGLVGLGQLAVVVRRRLG